MSEHTDERISHFPDVNVPFSRASMLKAAGVGLAASLAQPVLGMATARAAGPTSMSFPFYPQVSGTYTPEDIRDVLNMLVTMERFVVANVTANLKGPVAPGLPAIHVAIEQASAVSSLAHVDFLESLGAQALTDTFTVGAPPGITPAVLPRKELISTIYVAAYLTAARQFAEVGQPLLVKYSFQAGAEHAEHRALSRAVQAIEGMQQAAFPSNKAFETDLFVHVRDAYTVLSTLGIFGQLPVALQYPSRDAVLSAAGPATAQVIQTRPNNVTTSVTFSGPASILGPRP